MSKSDEQGRRKGRGAEKGAMDTALVLPAGLREMGEMRWLLALSMALSKSA